MEEVVSVLHSASQESDPYYEELNRLFYLYRLCSLNTRYYGRRAASYEGYTRWALIAIAIMSAIALTVILSIDPQYSWARTGALSLSGIATVMLAVMPSFGWYERAREFRGLHFAYSQLFGQIEAVIIDIRRSGRLTQECVGMSKVVHDMYLQLHALDETDPNTRIINEENGKVLKAFPDDYVWNRF